MSNQTTYTNTSIRPLVSSIQKWPLFYSIPLCKLWKPYSANIAFTSSYCSFLTTFPSEVYFFSKLCSWKTLRGLQQSNPVPFGMLPLTSLEHSLLALSLVLLFLPLRLASSVTGSPNCISLYFLSALPKACHVSHSSLYTIFSPNDLSIPLLKYYLFEYGHEICISILTHLHTSIHGLQCFLQKKKKNTLVHNPFTKHSKLNFITSPLIVSCYSFSHHCFRHQF